MVDRDSPEQFAATTRKDPPRERRLTAGRRGTPEVSRRQVLAGTVAGIGLLSNPVRAAAKTGSHRSVGAPAEFDHELSSGIFTIKYHDGYESDARQIADLLQYARGVVDEFYPHEYTHDVNVYLFEEGEWRPSSFRTGQWFSQGEVQRARIRMLAPSDHSRGKLYYRKNVVHEYTHLPLAVDYRSHSSPMLVPEWFNEGVPQYVAVHRTTDEIKQEYYNRDSWKEVRDDIRNGRGYLLDVGPDVYSGGPHLVEFMVDAFGRDVVASIPSTDAATFGEAIEVQTGLSPVEFELRWLEWANANLDADYQVDSFTTDDTVAASEYEKLEERNSELEAELQELREQNAALQRRVEDLQDRVKELTDEAGTESRPSTTGRADTSAAENSSTRAQETTPSTEAGTTDSSAPLLAPGAGTAGGLLGVSGYVGFRRWTSTPENSDGPQTE